jgi:hypothetical protein
MTSKRRTADPSKYSLKKAIHINTQIDIYICILYPPVIKHSYGTSLPRFSRQPLPGGSSTGAGGLVPCNFGTLVSQEMV